MSSPCPKCGSPLAYQGLIAIECSRAGCELCPARPTVRMAAISRQVEVIDVSSGYMVGVLTGPWPKGTRIGWLSGAYGPDPNGPYQVGDDA